MKETYLKSSFSFHLLESQERFVHNVLYYRGVPGRRVAFGPYRWTDASLRPIAATSPPEQP